MTPVPYHDHDGVDLAAVRASQEDPLVMYLVAPRRPAGPGGEVLAQAAVATVLCAERYDDDPAWREAFAEWRRSSFRKVCLGARPAERERVLALDHAECGEVLCLPPCRRSGAEPELARLQAHMGGPLRPAREAGRDPDRRAMTMLISEDLEMTLGKACAQVGHVALTACELHPAAATRAWRAAGRAVAVRLVGRDAFDRAKRELTVAAVRDAGLTQVAPGTETVLATEPGLPLPGWLLAGVRPIA